MIYLASPYTSQIERIRNTRALHAAQYTGWRMEKGDNIYSPVVHGHALDGHAAVSAEASASHQFWMGHCFGMLACADCLWLLPLDGWRESKGVWMEIERARSLGIKIFAIQVVPSYLQKAVEMLDEEEVEIQGWEVV